MLITPERLTYLVAIVEHGSFSAAARSLNVTASAVTQAIQNMEIDLGISVFQRTAGKAPKLTDVGKALYIQALEVAPRLQAMEKRAKAYQAGIEEKLNIATYGFTLSPNHAKAIGELSTQYPELKINMMDVEDIHGLAPNDPNGADIIIAPAKLHHRVGYESQFIEQINWRFVVIPSHPLAQKRAELSRHDLLTHVQLIPQVGGFADADLVESLRFSTNLIHCSRFYQLRSLLLQGVGFCLLPEQLSKPLLESHAVVELKMDFDDNQTRWPIEIAWSPSLGPAGSWFIEQFIEL
ncbi:LysR family transcriptional regulator [Vibrio comitans]